MKMKRTEKEDGGDHIQTTTTSLYGAYNINDLIIILRLPRGGRKSDRTGTMPHSPPMATTNQTLGENEVGS